MENNKIELYIYNKVNTELYFDVYEGSYGGKIILVFIMA